MANSPIVTSLPAWVDQQREPLIADVLLAARTASLFTLQSGIKSKAAINYIEPDVQFQAGACGWNEKGTVELTQREIETGIIKVNMAFCDLNLIGKWAEYQVRLAAGHEVLPFEEKFMQAINDQVKALFETALWQGDTSSEDGNLAQFDGMIKILKNESETITGSASVSADDLSTYITAAQKAALAIPSIILKYSDVVLFCSPSFLRAFGLAMVNANLFHFEPGVDYNDFVIPGTSIKLVAVGGLEGTDYLVGGRLSNFYYGCDLQNDLETYKLWYSDDNQEFRLKIQWNAGVQVAFPNEALLFTATSA